MYFNEYQSECIITILKTHGERVKDLEREKITKMTLGVFIELKIVYIY